MVHSHAAELRLAGICQCITRGASSSLSIATGKGVELALSCRMYSF